jgi:hypothetical protein
VPESVPVGRLTTFRKDRRLTIRLSSKDLEAIQKRALAEGVPYQTLISSLLHKYVSGRLKRGVVREHPTMVLRAWPRSGAAANHWDDDPALTYPVGTVTSASHEEPTHDGTSGRWGHPFSWRRSR